METKYGLSLLCCGAYKGYTKKEAGNSLKNARKMVKEYIAKDHIKTVCLYDNEGNAWSYAKKDDNGKVTYDRHLRKTTRK
jgi:hypothetical protein